MTTITSSATIQYLKPGDSVVVRFRKGHIFRAFPWEDVLRILRHNLADGVISRGGKLLYLRLLVSVYLFNRTMARSKLPPLSRRHVSAHYQVPGAKEWVQRFDKAKTGRMGSPRTVFAGGRGQN